MPICPTCQTELSDNDRFCPLCGNAVTKCESEQTVNTSVTKEEPAGIGGWLILVVIALVFSSIRNIIGGITDIANGAVLISLLEIAFGVLCVISLVFMFKQSRIFPKLYIGILCLNVVIGLICLIILLAMKIDLGTLFPQVIGSFISAGIWITYMRHSKRVKNTFVN